LRSRITENVMMPHRTPTANRSSMNPVAAHWPIPDRERAENSAPYASMIVSSSR